mmetsp:Transcript_3403/g.8759  ORF Transcript_3403/g.8759 Transcript_3403/m.8759 type:complete len:222 (-) Transcript_3403:533-1198(-)
MITSSGVTVSHGSSGVHMTSAARSASLPTTSEPTEESDLRREAMSFASGILRPWRQRIRVMTAAVGFPMSSSLASPSLSSDLSVPRTRLTVSLSIFARSLRDIWLKVASASSSSSTSTLSILAEIQSLSLRSSASATSDTSDARESSSSVSTVSARREMTPRTDEGPRSGQLVATCTLQTERASSSSCPHPPKSDEAMKIMLPASTTVLSDGPNIIEVPYP